MNRQAEQRAPAAALISTDPATGEVWGSTPDCGAADVDAAPADGSAAAVTYCVAVWSL